MRGPLGALPSLSRTTRRALAGCVLLAVANTAALVAVAWSLSGAVTAVVAGTPITHSVTILAGAVLARAAISWANQTVAARAAAGTKAELRAQLLDAALARGPEWIDDRHPAELTALATKGLDSLDDYFTRFLPALVAAVVVVPLVGLTILFADWRSAVIIALTVPLVPLFAALIGRFTETRVAAAAAATARLTSHLLELIRALPVLTAFGRAAAQETAVRDLSERHRRATGKTLRVAFLSAFALDLIATLSVALVAVDIGLRLLAADVGLGTALLVLILAPECYLPLRAAGAAFHASEDGLEAVRRVATIVGAEGNPVPEGVRPDGLRHQLDITGLRVRRRDRDAPDGLTVQVRPGRITRIDTPSGTGKSTTFAVLLRFTDATSGTVTVDGTELSTLDPTEWRGQIAWLPQRPRFSADHVTEELRQAAPAATEADITAVATDAVAEHLLHRSIEELSSGERQRVALARALLRLRHGAWLLLLDEPTAHLDPVTAAHIMSAIDKAAANGAAVLMATHPTATETAPIPAPATVPTTTRPNPTGTTGLRRLIDAKLLFGALLGALALGSAIALTATAAWLIARAAGHPSIVVLSVAVIGVRAFGLSKGALRYAERLVTHDAAFRLAGRLRVRLWRSVVQAGPARATDLRRFVDDVDTVRDLVPRVLTPPLSALLVSAGAVVLQTALLPEAGLALLVGLLIAGGAGPLLGLLAERHATKALAGGRRRVAGSVLTLLDCAADLIATGAHRTRRRDLAVLDAQLATTARRQAWGAGLTTGIATAALGFAALASTWLAAGQVNPVLAAVLALVPLAMAETVDGLGPALRQLDPLRAAHNRIAETVPPRTKVTTEDPLAGSSIGADDRLVGSSIGADDRLVGSSIGAEDPFAASSIGADDRLVGSSIGAEDSLAGSSIGTAGETALAGVTVAWPDATAPTLRDVNLRIPAGTEVAVLGPSGAGKSTLLALLLGFLRPDSGSASVPANVAWCPPEPYLSATTVRENLRLGDPTADDDTLRAALRTVALDDWTDRLDMRLGPGGAGASGGEAQRLALARAVLRAKDADLILLDEPTAHLDEQTARRALAGARKAFAGKTVVHVTHRADDAIGATIVINVTGGRLSAPVAASTVA